MNNILPTEGKDFIDSFKYVQEAVHQTAVEKGWWESEAAEHLLEASALVGGELASRLITEANNLIRHNDGEKIALMHSELSEALEALRHGNKPSEHIPEFSGVEEEFADVIIRIMNLSERRGWKIAEAVIAKAAFNATREYKHGGKKF